MGVEGLLGQKGISQRFYTTGQQWVDPIYLQEAPVILKQSQNSHYCPLAAIPPATEGPPLPEEVPPHPLVGLLEEETIDGEQGREEEEKEKEKEEEEELKLVCTRFVLCLLRKVGNG